MLLNRLSNEQNMAEVTEMVMTGIPDKKAFVKTYAKVLVKSAVQGAIISFAVLGVTAVIASAVAAATDGDTATE